MRGAVLLLPKDLCVIGGPAFAQARLQDNAVIGGSASPKLLASTVIDCLFKVASQRGRTDLWPRTDAGFVGLSLLLARMDPAFWFVVQLLRLKSALSDL